MYKIKTTAGAENSIAVLIPAEVLENFGISAGDEIEVNETDNALILRSVDGAERKRKFDDAKDKVFEKWHNVFVELAK